MLLWTTELHVSPYTSGICVFVGWIHLRDVFPNLEPTHGGTRTDGNVSPVENAYGGTIHHGGTHRERCPNAGNNINHRGGVNIDTGRVLE